MSTTVIASPQGLSLFLFAAYRPRIDEERVGAVLARHGLQMLPTALRGNEFIAAQGLSHVDADRLAQELEAVGLTVRVVNRTGLTQSSRVSAALFAQMVIGAPLLMTAMAAMESLPIAAVVALAVAVLWTASNAMALGWRGSTRLRVAGSLDESTGVPLLSAQMVELRDSLPDHVLQPLVRRAQAMEAQVRDHPQGSAARELEALRGEFTAIIDERAVAEVKDLKADLARARRAVHEVKG